MRLSRYYARAGEVFHKRASTARVNPAGRHA